MIHFNYSAAPPPPTPLLLPPFSRLVQTPYLERLELIDRHSIVTLVFKKKKGVYSKNMDEDVNLVQHIHFGCFD